MCSCTSCSCSSCKSCFTNLQPLEPPPRVTPYLKSHLFILGVVTEIDKIRPKYNLWNIHRNYTSYQSLWQCLPTPTPTTSISLLEDSLILPIMSHHIISHHIALCPQGYGTHACRFSYIFTANGAMFEF